MRQGKWTVHYRLKCCVIVNALIECKIAFSKVVRQSLKSFYRELVLVWHHRSSSSFLMVSFCLSTLQISFPLEESVSTIGSYCMSSSFPPLSLDLVPLLVAESDDEGSKKALKKVSIKLFIKSR